MELRIKRVRINRSRPVTRTSAHLGSRDEGSFLAVKLYPLPFGGGYLYHGTLVYRAEVLTSPPPPTHTHTHTLQLISLTLSEQAFRNC